MNFKVKSLATNKCTGNELGFLVSLGWEVISGFEVRGSEPVEVNEPDRYTTRIIDSRFDKGGSYYFKYILNQ